MVSRFFRFSPLIQQTAWAPITMSDPKKTETSAPALDAWTKWVAHGSRRALDPLGLDEEKINPPPVSPDAIKASK